MELSLAQIEQATGAQLVGEGSTDLKALGWSIDSRSIQPGDVFFAITGERFDGHAFVQDALDAGASAAIVSQDVKASGGLIFKVDNSVRALWRTARFGRSTWAKPVIAITGSSGKTSTKDIVAALLSERFIVGKTVGNLNNHLGLPLTLLRIPDKAQLAVVEMGMNHAGEIRELARIAQPQIGVVTNVGYAHIEAFESIEAIAAAKRELIEELPPGGVAVLNADDERVFAFRQSHRGQVLTYGTGPDADIRAEQVNSDAEGASFSVRGIQFKTKLTGQHSVSNILAGLAVASTFEIPLEALVNAVSKLRPGKMRGERCKARGVTILNDSYNSNPAAARSMIDVLAAEPATRKIAVLGEMLELGPWTEVLHRELGRYAMERGVDVLIGVSGASRSMVDEAMAAGLGKHIEMCDHTSPCNRAAFFFEDSESAGEFLRQFVQPGDAVLFKGSRGTHVERALARMEE